MSEDKYDLKESKRSVGELYPVLKDAHGNIIDGFHRLKDEPEWRQETNERIQTRTQLCLARIIANTHRRTVSREERSTQVQELAKALIEENKVQKEEMIKVISELTTFSARYVQELLPEEYKRGYTKSELSSQLDITVPIGAGVEFPVSPEPSTSVGAEAKETSPIIEAEPTDAVSKFLRRLKPEDFKPEVAGGNREFIIHKLGIDCGMRPDEAEAAIRQFRKEQETHAVRAQLQEVEKQWRGYAPVTPKTTKCPLCNRDGADRDLIQMHIEESGQVTLEKFVTR